MAPIDVTQRYYTYEGRLASFQIAQPLTKRRASNASSKATKTIRWPHSFLSPEEMAKAGFFHYPTQDNPDNTTCFLCRKSLDGWEENDDPLVEHLKHSPDCGWAIVASIDARHTELSREYPLSARMIEARKATFGDRWPHEDKKGWKCKAKQLVDAGWKYTPTPDYDDMATCAYCELALDGWEPSDKPLDEHQKRSPDCAFFSLIKSYEETSVPKKAAKGRKSRASKASRLSTQSTFTAVSEGPSIIDISADVDDSIVTTATNVTVTSQAVKKMPKTKKSTRGRKTKTNNEETIEVSAMPEAEDADFEIKVPEPRARKGKKRTSDAMEDGSALMDAQQPPAKRRGTRNMRGSTMVEESVIVSLPAENADAVMTNVDDPVQQNPEPKRKRGRPSAAKSKRNFSTASTASKASLRVEMPDDDEIERALEADLERSLTDGEDNNLTIEPPKPCRESRVKKSTVGASAAPIRKTSRNSKVPHTGHDMFAVGNISVDEAAIEAELEAMEFEPISLPKAKGAKAKQPRKASAKQQAAARRAEEAAQAQIILNANVSAQELAPDPKVIESGGHAAPKRRRGRNAGSVASSRNRADRPTRASGTSTNEVELSVTLGVDDVHDSGNETDTSIASQSTIVKGGTKRRSSNSKTKGGKKGFARNIEEIVNQPAEASHVEQQKEEAPKKKPVGRSKKAIQAEEESTKEEVQNIVTSVLEQPSVLEPVVKPAKGRPAKAKGKTKTLPKLPVEAEKDKSEGKDDPAPRSPNHPPKELTPSLSPQSSDAENLPPSSRPSTNKPPVQQGQASRVPLAPGTPTMSPSKRNIVAGLQSTYPWAAVDLDDILLKSPSDVQTEKENSATNLLGEAIGNVKKGELTSPEKKMTVEEWILFNASLAEEKLRGECERMVGVFETEGGRAMRVLEGLVTVD